jgi:hypothetical protein
MHGQNSFIKQSAGMESCLKNAISEEKNVKSLPILYHNQCNLVYKVLLLKSSAFIKIGMVCAKSSVAISSSWTCALTVMCLKLLHAMA